MRGGLKAVLGSGELYLGTARGRGRSVGEGEREIGLVAEPERGVFFGLFAEYQLL